MRNLATIGCGSLVLVALVGCGANTVPSEEAFTDADRAQIEAEVHQIMADIYDAAKRADMGPMMAIVPDDAGICLWGSAILDCQQVFDQYREAWNSEDERRLERQEMDGEALRVMALSPTVAIGVHTTEENRAIYTTGEVFKARFASFTVFVLEEDGWKIHSGQQASWPIEGEGGG